MVTLPCVKLAEVHNCIGLHMIAELAMRMHLYDVDLIMHQVVLQPILVVSSKHLHVAWLSLIQHWYCKVWFGPCLWVAALVARLGLAWAGLIPAAALRLF